MSIFIEHEEMHKLRIERNQIIFSKSSTKDKAAFNNILNNVYEQLTVELKNMGYSGGAIFALKMARSQPQAVRAMVVHEPPVVRILTDSKKWQSFFANVYRMAFKYGD